MLDRALAGEADGNLTLHRIRALIHLGRLAEAEQALAQLGDGESLGRRLVSALRATREAGAANNADFARRVAGHAASETYLNGLFSMTLPALVGNDALAKAFQSPAALADLLEALLDRMAGNLGPSPTFAETLPTGEPRFVPVAVPATTREQATAVLHSLPYVGVEGVMGAFDAALERHPRSVHLRCYLGELHLWQGRYEDAWREFDSASAIEPARWADIGKLAVLALTGRTTEAARLATETEQRFSPIIGGTLPVYRGLLRRRMGALDEAIADFCTAFAAKSGRKGVRIELCLALRSAGRRSEATEHAGLVLQEVAPLLVDVADGRGVDWRRDPTRLLDDVILEDALRAMRGNRSSVFVTWVDRDGAFRVLESYRSLHERARAVLEELGFSG